MILTLGIAGVIAAIAVFIFTLLAISSATYKENLLKERLLAMKDAGEPTAQQGPPVEKGLFDDMFREVNTFSEPISHKLYGNNTKFQQEIKTLLTEAGRPDSDQHVWKFITHRVAVGLICGVIGLPLGLILGKTMTMALGGAIVGMLGGSMMPQMKLRGLAGKRKKEIQYRLPDALDLMVICVESGLGLDSTIFRVAEEMKHISPELAGEFSRLNLELNAGIKRQEAFHNLGSRSGVEELKTLCSLIVQSDKLGTSIADTLRVCADDMRVRRKQKAEELASKASVKMTIPLVFFIFPPIFIVLMGPTVLTAMDTFLAK
ncbi:MAG: type II secretion system F family protein [Candidatus Melainabacteria bacterium]